MSKRHNITIGAIGYALMGLIAFGPSAAEGERKHDDCKLEEDQSAWCGGYVPVA